MKRQTNLQTAARRMTALTRIGGLMKRRLMMVLVMLGISVGFALFGAQSASAAILTVTKTADTNDGVCDADCSLREAIAQAAAGDTVVFAAPLFDTPQIININGQLVINKNLTVTGRAANLLTIRNVAAASNTSRIFNINGAFTAELSGMTVTGGNISDNSGGGGIRIVGGSATTLRRVHVTGNTSPYSRRYICFRRHTERVR